MLGFARGVERLGYASVWVSDHVVIPARIASRYPYSPTGDFPLPVAMPFLEPLTTLSLVAGATERIRLGTSILVLPHRHPLLAAKALATLDHLAPGRVIVGAGVGWLREEIELFGVDHETRGAWSDEALQVMRACWRDERASFRGRFFAFEEVACAPRPAAGTLPIWIGGHTDRALRRVVELGDGWQAAFTPAADLAPALARLRAACEQAGRDPATVTLSARMGLPARRPAGALAAELHALRNLGVRHVVLEARVDALPRMLEIYEGVVAEVGAPAPPRLPR